MAEPGAGTAAALLKFAEKLGVARFMFVLFALTLLILLLPERVWMSLEVGDSIQHYRLLVVLVCGFTGLFWLSYPIFGACRVAGMAVSGIGFRIVVRNHLRHLAPDEKIVLRDFFYEGRTRSLDETQGVTHNLVRARILYQSSPFRNVTGGFAHTINSDALEYLKKHPDLLK